MAISNINDREDALTYILSTNFYKQSVMNDYIKCFEQTKLGNEVFKFKMHHSEVDDALRKLRANWYPNIKTRNPVVPPSAILTNPCAEIVFDRYPLECKGEFVDIDRIISDLKGMV